MPFGVPRAVLALSIRLVYRLSIYPGTDRSCALVVRFNIIHVDEETGVRDVCRRRGVEAVLRRRAMQPN